MTARSSSIVCAVVGMAAGFGLAGCNRGGEPSGTITSSIGATSTSQAPATLDATAAKTASCAVFKKAIVKANTANDAFGHAVDDPKRPGPGWNKPTSDAADNAAVILAYVAKDVESNAIKPQLTPGLADQFKQFVQLTRDRVNLFNQHMGTEELNANGTKWGDVANKLIDTCK